jgi:NAD(P)-dependent dehydrogenase (short-subunit alcohol dehydrogenase family)
VAPLVEIELGDWEQTIRTNLTSVFLMCRAFAPQMVMAGRGHIVNIASVAAKRPLAGRTPYCASKAGVIALTTTLAAELAPSGIAVNCLSPGPVDSARMRHNFAREAERTGITYAEAEAAYVGRSMLNRLLTADEVAGAVLAMLGLSGLQGADLDLSAGMVAR